MRRTQLAGIALVLLAALFVTLVLWQPWKSQTAAPPTVTQVRGIVGSEKKPLFDDPRVQEIFRENGLDVQVSVAGSREIAQQDLSGQDFVFPSSAPAADAITGKTSSINVHTPFYSPMVVASFTPVTELLKTVDVVTEYDGQDVFNVDKYLELVAQNARWNGIPDNTTYPSSKGILISSTDIRKSNSAAMYLAITSYVANGNQIIDRAGIDKVYEIEKKLFLGQGYSGSSSEDPFNEYLTQGMGSRPLVLIYEAQYLRQQIVNPQSVKSDMNLVYLNPTILSKHPLVALTPPGDRVGELLANDPSLLKEATRHGFRINDSTIFQSTMAESQIVVPESVPNVVDPPTYEVLEDFIARLEKDY